MILKIPAARRVYERGQEAARLEGELLSTREAYRDLSRKYADSEKAAQAIEREYYTLKSRHFAPVALPSDKTAPQKRYPETWISFDQLPTLAPYRPTFQFEGEYINDQHRRYGTCPLGHRGMVDAIEVGIDGYLSRGDALKLYEMAYFAKGDILELGTHLGLSTSILAQALHDVGSKQAIDAVDIDPETNRRARATLAPREGFERIRFHVQDATAYLDAAIAQGKKYGFAFIDHWHGYDTTFEAAERVKKLLLPGGFCFFHDLTDPGNADPNHVYGVYQAVVDSMLVDSSMEFYGLSGCCALFRCRDV